MAGHTHRGSTLWRSRAVFAIRRSCRVRPPYGARGADVAAIRGAARRCGTGGPDLSTRASTSEEGGDRATVDLHQAGECRPGTGSSVAQVPEPRPKKQQSAAATMSTTNEILTPGR